MIAAEVGTIRGWPACLLAVAALTIAGCAARPTASANAPFSAARSKPVPNPAGRVFTIEEHPFMFYGQLASGGSACDAVKGFSFASVKDLSGPEVWECDFDVTRDESAPAMNWIAKCGAMFMGAPVMKVTIMQISDETVEGRDGEKVYRPTLYLNEMRNMATEASLMRCMYQGFVMPRPPQ